MKADLNSNNFLEAGLPEKQAADIAKVLLELATNSAVLSEMPDLDPHVKNLTAAMEKGYPNSIERHLVILYSQLHGKGLEYSPSEKELLRKRSGYSNIPGGLSPIIMAEHFIGPGTTVADLGAGNGLQGLLLQRIYPHRKTIQIELSAEMIRIGRIYQQALDINNNLIEWIHDDIINVSIENADFIYIYRPAKPIGNGNEIYRTIARKVNDINKPVIIFSVADCLAEFLDKRFSIFYTDGHLTCFSKKK